MKTASGRELLIARVALARDRLSVLLSRTSNPELLERIRDLDAMAAALESECHRVFVGPGLSERVEWQARVVERLVADVDRDLN